MVGLVCVAIDHIGRCVVGSYFAFFSTFPLNGFRISRSAEGDGQEIGGRLIVFEAIGNHTQGQRLHVRDSFLPCRAVCHHASQIRHFGNPAAINLAIDLDVERHGTSFSVVVIYHRFETAAMPRRHPRPRNHLGTLSPRYQFVLNPYRRERFTKCPTCEAPTKIRKIPLVVHVGDRGTPQLALLNKTCRLCVQCETLVVDRAELERVLIGAGFGAAVHKQDYVVLGTIDRRTWRRGFAGAAELPDIRAQMADFKKYLSVEVVPQHRAPSIATAG
jgi:hypothetical protein